MWRGGGCAAVLAAMAVLGPSTAIAAYPQLPPVLPDTASRFVASIGVNVHLGYLDTSYGDYAMVRARLLELGVHAIRDAACAACTEQQARLLDLAGAGIRTDLIMGSPEGPESLDRLVGLVAGPLRPAALSVEGPNEFDRSDAPDWSFQLRDYQQRLYEAVRAEPALDDVEVLGPSLTKPESYPQLGPLAPWVDCASIHPYSDGGEPDEQLGGDLLLAHITSAEKPVCATEAGWHDAMAATRPHPTSDAAAAVYVPRLYLDFFRAGVPRTFLYELADQLPDGSGADPERHYGLLRADFSEKPAFASLRRLVDLVETPNQAPPTALRFVTDGPPDLQQTFLQQDATHQVLVLWRDVAVWDRDRHQDIAVAPEPVDVRLGQRVEHVDVTPVGPTPEAPQTLDAPTDVHVELGAQPVVLRVTLPSP